MIDPQRKGISDDILFQRGLKGEGLALLKSVDINRSSPKGARGLTEYFFDVVISLEAARWALFSCQTNVTIKLRNMTSL
ncbi:hypothetical protein FQH76_10240 [Escherichia coli]|nr:hypothetical protein [Escherichia coli]EEW2086769.1 hypothetical protein [Escherichia coli]EFB6578967.1 hypothetical protein [Escherichia coli]EFN3817208.1 hypothetical protein [Escherichia coli]EFN4359252.1 hypothetical protein [Escherichia coli]